MLGEGSTMMTLRYCRLVATIVSAREYDNPDLTWQSTKQPQIKDWYANDVWLWWQQENDYCTDATPMRRVMTNLIDEETTIWGGKKQIDSNTSRWRACQYFLHQLEPTLSPHSNQVKHSDIHPMSTCCIVSIRHCPSLLILLSFAILNHNTQHRNILTT
jgi:hypothetical protein